MSKEDQRAHDLAVKIYVELISRNTDLSQGSVKLATSASNIAVLSLKLSAAFFEAEDEIHASREPTKGAALKSDDIAAWMR